MKYNDFSTVFVKHIPWIYGNIYSFFLPTDAKFNSFFLSSLFYCSNITQLFLDTLRERQIKFGQSPTTYKNWENIIVAFLLIQLFMIVSSIYWCFVCFAIKSLAGSGWKILAGTGNLIFNNHSSALMRSFRFYGAFCRWRWSVNLILVPTSL